MASECSKTSTKGLEVTEGGSAKPVPNDTKEGTGDAGGGAMEAKVKEPDAKEDATANTGDPEPHHGEVEGSASNTAGSHKDAQANAGNATVNEDEKKADSKDQSGKGHKKVDASHSSSSSSSSSSDSEGKGKPGCAERKKKTKKGKADQVKGGGVRDSNKTKMENCKC